MTIKEKKAKLLNWVDFYGQDVPDKDEIQAAKTNEDIKNILSSHQHFLELQHCDALSHLAEFHNELFD